MTENSSFYEPILAGAIEMNEIFKILMAGGFTEDQALKVVSNLMLRGRVDGDQG